VLRDSDCATTIDSFAWISLDSEVFAPLRPTAITV
jgi:hypothetical protein